MSINVDELHSPLVRIPSVVHAIPLYGRSLPANIRWEVAPRHPYYQMYWRAARDFYENKPATSPLEAKSREAAVCMLSAIGIAGNPPDPKSTFESLGGNENPVWQSRAIQPVTCRGLAQILIGMLPQSALGELSTLFAIAACGDRPGEAPIKVAMINELRRLKDESLDHYPADPYFCLDPAASERQVNEAVNLMLKEQKERLELDQTRARPEKYAEYLQVWDEREGWCDGGYEPSKLQLLKQIAGQCRRSLSTVMNQYKSGFLLITGFEFSPELWFELFGVPKLSAVADIELRRFRYRRATTSRSYRPVNESTLIGSAGHTITPVSGAAQSSDKPNYKEMCWDIQQLIDDGFKNELIIEKLELPPIASELVALIRSQGLHSFFSHVRGE